MSTTSPISIIDRFLSRPRPLWVSILASVAILALPFLAALLDGVFTEVIANGGWRIFMLPASLVTYIWCISPPVSRISEQANQAIISMIKDKQVDPVQIIQQSGGKSWVEWLVLLAGLALGLIAGYAAGIEQNLHWLTFYWLLLNAVMYALLMMLIYAAFTSTRIIAALHRQELEFDLFEPASFDAIGRQSLVLAIAFLGGISVSVLFSFSSNSLAEPGFWVGFTVMVIITILIFFQSMQPTHRVMLRAKQKELEPVRDQLKKACRELTRRIELGMDTSELPGQIQALDIYEQRLLATRTWPYNTAMLRTLFFSVFIPLLTVLGRLVVEVVSK